MNIVSIIKTKINKEAVADDIFVVEDQTEGK